MIPGLKREVEAAVEEDHQHHRVGPPWLGHGLGGEDGAADPRQAQQERPGEDEGVGAPSVPGLEVPPEVLADDVGVEPGLVPPRDDDVPRQGQREEHGERPGREEPRHDRETPRQSGPDEDRAPGEDEPEEPLRHDGARAGDVEDVERPARAAAVPRPFVLLEGGEGEGRRRHPERHGPVRDVQPADRHDEERRRQDETREERDPLAVAPPREEDRDEDRPDGGEPGGDPGGPLRLPENRHRGRHGPVVERRLDVGEEAVDPRRDEVAGREHLARDLRVAGLVGLEEGGVPRLEEVEAGREEEESPEDRPGACPERFTAESRSALHVQFHVNLPLPAPEKLRGPGARLLPRVDLDAEEVRPRAGHAERESDTIACGSVESKRRRAVDPRRTRSASEGYASSSKSGRRPTTPRRPTSPSAVTRKARARLSFQVSTARSWRRSACTAVTVVRGAPAFSLPGAVMDGSIALRASRPL